MTHSRDSLAIHIITQHSASLPSRTQPHNATQHTRHLGYDWKWYLRSATSVEALISCTTACALSRVAGSSAAQRRIHSGTRLAMCRLEKVAFALFFACVVQQQHACTHCGGPDTHVQQMPRLRELDAAHDGVADAGHLALVCGGAVPHWGSDARAAGTTCCEPRMTPSMGPRTA